MKAISILQPWASLISVGAKEIETRSWATNCLAIHASKRYPKDLQELAKQEQFYSALRPDGNYQYPELHLGCIIAVCQLVDCQRINSDELPPEPEASFGDYTPGRYAWLLTDVKRITPVAVKGQLGLWNWEPPEMHTQGIG